VSNDFNKGVFHEVAHRPWPLSRRPWIMTQTWHDLLFAHWPTEPAVLAARVPAVFEVDLFHGQAWVGIVPFRMTNVAPRGVPALPWVSAFPELNVRTYVRVANRPGIYFFSLDAGNALAALAAKAWLNLPYYAASMSVTARHGVLHYVSRRRGGQGPVFDATYAPSGTTFRPQHGSLEHFLTERYCLYALDHGARPYRLEIHHPPWRLQQANAAIAMNSMAASAGITLPQAAPLCHFARRQDMIAWSPKLLRE
jgi:uncharacterized protein